MLNLRNFDRVVHLLPVIGIKIIDTNIESDAKFSVEHDFAITSNIQDDLNQENSFEWVETDFSC